MNGNPALPLILAAALIGLARPADIRAQAAAPAFEQRVKIEVIRSRKVRPKNYFEKADTVSFQVRLTNSDTRAAFEGLGATLYMFGQNTEDRSQWKFLGKGESSFSLPARGAHEFETGEIKLEYNDMGSIRYGYKFDCWILIVRDASGNVVCKKGSSARFLDQDAKLSGLKEGDVYDQKLDPVKSRVY